MDYKFGILQINWSPKTQSVRNQAPKTFTVKATTKMTFQCKEQRDQNG
jgi:hypothetical protein